MKKFMFVSMIVFVFFMVACASTETAQNPSESKSSDEFEEGPCAKEIANAGETFTAIGVASGARMRASSITTAAIAQARAQMAQNIKGAYKGMVSDYMKQLGLNNKTDTEDKLEKAGDQIIDTTIPTTQVICQKTRKIDDENIETHVAIKAVTPELIKNITAAVSTNLTMEERSLVEFDEQKYRDQMQERFKQWLEFEKAKKEEYDKKQEEKKQEEK